MSSRSRAVAGTAVLIAAVTVGTGFYASGHKMAGAWNREAVGAASGTIVDLKSAVRLTSRETKPGTALTAKSLVAVLDDRGDTLIPVGATWTGRVVRIQPFASQRERGTLDVVFQAVSLGSGDAAVAIGTRVMSLGTHVEFARVRSNGWGGGAGSGSNGGLLHPREGEREIVLPAGGMIRLALTQPFAPGMSSAR